MAQSTYIFENKGTGNQKGLITQVGKMNFATTALSAKLSTSIKYLKFAKFTPVSATYKSSDASDMLDAPSAAIVNARSIIVNRTASGKSGLNFWYMLVGY